MARLMLSRAQRGQKPLRPLMIAIGVKKTLENLELFSKVPIFANDMKREEVISSIKQVALKTLPPYSTLLFYGSRARGDDHKGSDWDLLILLDKASLTFNDYSVGYPFRELGWEINEEINRKVDQ